MKNYRTRKIVPFLLMIASAMTQLLAQQPPNDSSLGKPPIYFGVSATYRTFNFQNKTHTDYPPSWSYPVLSHPNKAFGHPGGISLGLFFGFRGGRRIQLEVEGIGTYYKSSQTVENYRTSFNFYSIQIASRLGFIFSPESKFQAIIGPSLRYQRILPIIFSFKGRNSMERYDIVLKGKGQDLGIFADVVYRINDRYDINAGVYSPIVDDLAIRATSYKIRTSPGFRTFYWTLGLRLKMPLF